MVLVSQHLNMAHIISVCEFIVCCVIFSIVVGLIGLFLYNLIHRIVFGEEKMKPFYRFTIDMETGKIRKLVIDNYTEHHNSKGYGYYRYVTSHYCFADPKDFGRCKNHRVYLWEDDEEKAKRLIEGYFFGKIDLLEKQADKYRNIIKLMRDYERR